MGWGSVFRTQRSITERTKQPKQFEAKRRGTYGGRERSPSSQGLEPALGAIEPGDRTVSSRGSNGRRRSGSRGGGGRGSCLRMLGRLIGDGIRLVGAGVDVELANFVAVERTGAAAAEDGELIAGLVDGAVAVDAFGDGESGAFGMAGGDELGSRTGTEAGEMGGVVPGGKNFEDAQAVVAVGDEGKGAAGDHADFYVVDVVHGAVGIEHLIQLGRFGLFDVDNGHAVLACRDVSVSASDINIARVVNLHQGAADGLGLGEIGNVENLEAIAVNQEGIAE